MEDLCGIKSEIDLWREISGNFNRTDHLRFIPPIVPTTVFVALTFMTLTELDEHKSTISGLVYVTKAWTDHRLIKNDCTLKAIPPEGVPLNLRLLSSVWQPSIGIISALKADTPKMPQVFDQTLLTYDADAESFRLTNTHSIAITVPCVANFHHFPFDTTECHFVVSTPKSHPDMTNITWWPDGKAAGMSGQFNTLSSHYVAELIASKENIDGILQQKMIANIIRVRLRRFSMFYILQGYVPNIITVLVSWFSFFIKPDAVPARVSIAVSSLIAIMLQYANLVKTIPKVGYFKSIDLWMLMCVVFIFVVQAEYALICCLKRQKHKFDQEFLSAIDRQACIGMLSVFSLFAGFYFSLLGR